ncbi:POTRA domain-containing protein [Psychromonas sp. MME2]|uniref:autotransporter assembly complex protein TamA n=1 Tax=Psychromonas sp. MME2 TaxID=3231033 RepID=UPI00339C0EDD
MRALKLLILFSLALFHIIAVAKVSFEINGVNKNATENVLIFLKGLNEPDNLQHFSFIKQVKESTTEALVALGYYNASIQIETEQQSQLVKVTIIPGERTRITKLDLKLTGEGVNDQAFQKLLTEFDVKENAFLNHGKYESAKSSLLNLSRQRGYFDAKYEKSSVEVSAKTNSAIVYFWFNTGPRYQFGELKFSAILPAEQQVIALRKFKVGQPFEYQKLRKYNADLSKTGYFKNITIVPEIKNKQGLLIPLTVEATMRPEDSFNVGLGYSTDQEIRSKLRWNRPWVNDYGHSIEGNLIVSAEQQEINFTYKIPEIDAIYNYDTVQAGYKKLNQNDTDTQQYLLGLNRNSLLQNQWQLTTFIKYDHEYGRQGQQEYSKRSIIPGVTFSRSRQRGGMNPYWGDKKLVSIEFSNQWWLSDEDLIKVYGQYKLLRSINRTHEFFINTEFGAIYTQSIEDVPSSMRFFTGGIKLFVVMITKVLPLKIAMAT